MFLESKDEKWFLSFGLAASIKDKFAHLYLIPSINLYLDFELRVEVTVQISFLCFWVSFGYFEFK